MPPQMGELDEALATVLTLIWSLTWRKQKPNKSKCVYYQWHDKLTQAILKDSSIFTGLRNIRLGQ